MKTLLRVGAVLIVVAAVWLAIGYHGCERVAVRIPGKPTAVYAPPPLVHTEEVVVPRPGGFADTVPVEEVRDPVATVYVPTDSAEGVTLLVDEVQPRLLPKFRRYRDVVEVGVLDAPYDAEEILVAPQPRSLLDVQLRGSAGATWPPVGAYAAVSPARIWGFEPAWFVGANAGEEGVRIGTGPGVLVEVYDRVDVGGYYDVVNGSAEVTLGIRF